MYRLKIFILGIFLAGFCSTVYLAAADGESGSSWWEGKTIEAIEFNGLTNVEQGDLDGVREAYVGSRLTQENFSSIQNDLYELGFFNYFYVYAEKSRESDDAVILQFTVSELPQIAAVEFSGNTVFSEDEMMDIVSSSPGDFFVKSQLKDDAEAVKEAYIQKGYADVSVDESYTVDEESNTAAIRFSVTEGLQSKIKEISFSGNSAFSDTTLKRKIESKEQTLFNKGNLIQSTLDSDKTEIVNFYRNNGYLDASIEEIRIEPYENQSPETEKFIQLTFVINEGQLWTFGGYEIEGNTIFSDEELKADFQQQPGDVVSISEIQSDINRIADNYYNEGYIFNEISTREVRNQDEQTFAVTVQISEKGQATIDSIILKGNEKTKDHVILREMTMSEGDIFSKEELTTSVRNIYNTGIIDSVEVNPLYTEQEGVIDLEVKVEESNKIDLRFGATFGGQEEFPVSGFLDWTDKNFLGRGQDFSISLQASPAEQSLNFSFLEGWLFERRWSGGVNLSASHSKVKNVRQDYELPYGVPDPDSTMEYDKVEFGTGVSTGYTFHTDEGRINLSSGLNFSLSNVFYNDEFYRPYDSTIRMNHDRWVYNNTFSFKNSWDRRDLIYNPTKGTLLENKITLAGGYLNIFGEGGSLNYVKNQTMFGAYLGIPVVPKNDYKATLSFESTFSFMFPQFDWNGEIQATPMEKLFVDGMNTARGWSVAGGNYDKEVLWHNMLQLRFPFAEKIIWGELYTSATSVLDNHMDMGQLLQRENVYFSSGFGIKLGIQGLPLGIYLAKNYKIAEEIDNPWMPFEADSETGDLLGMDLVFAIDYDMF